MWVSYVVSQREKLTPEGFYSWMDAQTHIAKGTAVLAAALEKVNATPIEGFDTSALDETLQLKELELMSSRMLP